MFFVLKRGRQFKHNNHIMFEFMKHVMSGKITQNFLDELREKKNYIFREYSFGWVEESDICTFMQKDAEGLVFNCFLTALKMLLEGLRELRNSKTILITFDGFRFTVTSAIGTKEKMLVRLYSNAHIYTRLYLEHDDFIFYLNNSNSWFISALFQLLDNTVCMKEFFFNGLGESLEWNERDVGRSFFCDEVGFEILANNMIDVKYDGGGVGFVMHKDAYLSCVHDWEGYEKRSDVDDVKLITIVVKGTYGKVTFKTSQELGL